MSPVAYCTLSRHLSALCCNHADYLCTLLLLLLLLFSMHRLLISADVPDLVENFEDESK
jgi:hypothetical protein